MNRAKEIVLICTCLLGFSFSQAQQAPDFQVWDAGGFEHNLYSDYLNQDLIFVLGLFYVDCPDCDALMQAVQASFTAHNLQGDPVQYMLFSGVDDNYTINEFKANLNLSLPIVGPEGYAENAMDPYTGTNEFGPFFGYPMFVVISPTGQVIYDPQGNNPQETVEAINLAIEEFLSTTTDIESESLQTKESFTFYDNSLIFTSNSDSFSGSQINVYDLSGKLLISESVSSPSANLSTLHLEKGAYIATASSEGRRISLKFIK